jgi:hypothetical protein
MWNAKEQVERQSRASSSTGLHNTISPTINRMLRLQHAGNRAVARLAGGLAQPKATDFTNRHSLIDGAVRDEPANRGHHLLAGELDAGSPDRADYEAIRKMGVADERGKPITNLQEYLHVRRRQFGAQGDTADAADQKYWQFKAEAAEELAADAQHPKARRFSRLLDPEAPHAPHAALESFYTWLRRAYMDHGVHDVPAAIRQAQLSGEQLTKSVKSKGKQLVVEGANPRPEKSAQQNYELGTLSEHAFGNAVDINSRQNPVFGMDEWKTIEKAAGVAVPRNHNVWKTLWQKNPGALWETIQEINDAFVLNVRAVEFASAHHLLSSSDLNRPPGPATRTPSLPRGQTPQKLSLDLGPPLFASREVRNLLADKPKLLKYRHGFFTHDRHLVESLQQQGLVWGAVFENKVDLHHFEVPTQNAPLPAGAR